MWAESGRIAGTGFCAMPVLADEVESGCADSSFLAVPAGTGSMGYEDGQMADLLSAAAHALCEPGGHLPYLQSQTRPQHSVCLCSYFGKGGEST